MDSKCLYGIWMDTDHVVWEKHGHGGRHQAVQNGDKDYRTRNSYRNVLHWVLHLLCHCRDCVVTYVAKVHHGCSVEHSGGTIREEPRWVSFWITCFSEVFPFTLAETHHDDEQDENDMERRQGQIHG